MGSKLTPAGVDGDDEWRATVDYREVGDDDVLDPAKIQWVGLLYPDRREQLRGFMTTHEPVWETMTAEKRDWFMAKAGPEFWDKTPEGIERRLKFMKSVDLPSNHLSWAKSVELAAVLLAGGTDPVETGVIWDVTPHIGPWTHELRAHTDFGWITVLRWRPPGILGGGLHLLEYDKAFWHELVVRKTLHPEPVSVPASIAVGPGATIAEAMKTIWGADPVFATGIPASMMKTMLGVDPASSETFTHTVTLSSPEPWHITMEPDPDPLGIDPFASGHGGSVTKKGFPLRLEEELKEAAKSLADSDDMSMNAWLVKLIRDEVRKRGAPGEFKPKPGDRSVAVVIRCDIDAADDEAYEAKVGAIVKTVRGVVVAHGAKAESVRAETPAPSVWELGSGLWGPKYSAGSGLSSGAVAPKPTPTPTPAPLVVSPATYRKIKEHFSTTMAVAPAALDGAVSSLMGTKVVVDSSVPDVPSVEALMSEYLTSRRTAIEPEITPCLPVWHDEIDAWRDGKVVADVPASSVPSPPPGGFAAWVKETGRDKPDEDVY